jgi:hypothetical protein
MPHPYRFFYGKCIIPKMKTKNGEGNGENNGRFNPLK